MSRTHRRKTVWYRHERPTIRRRYNKSIRLLNKLRLSKGQEVERHDKTRGWLTW